MKDKIDNIKEKFNSILCHCAETTEFLNKSQILKLIAKEASQGMKECKELEEIRMNVEGLLSKRLDCLKENLKTIEKMGKENPSEQTKTKTGN